MMKTTTYDRDRNRRWILSTGLFSWFFCVADSLQAINPNFDYEFTGAHPIMAWIRRDKRWFFSKQTGSPMT